MNNSETQTTCGTQDTGRKQIKHNTEILKDEQHEAIEKNNKTNKQTNKQTGVNPRTHKG